MKIWFTNAVLLGTPASKENIEIVEKLKTASGAEAKSLGRKIKDLSNATWDRDSSGVMRNILKLSFEQNPDALAKLLATGNAELTHTQDKGKWGKEFPKLLMEVRQELTKPTTEVKPAEVTETLQDQATTQITNAYNLLTEEQKKKVGDLQNLINQYKEIPFETNVNDFIEQSINCKK